MGLTYKNNAPVKFITGNYVGHNDRTCHTDQFQFCQYVERADTTLYQVGVTANTNNLVTDTAFNTACGVNWTCGVDWNIAAGVATKIPGGANNSLTQPLCIMRDRYYNISFFVSVISAGTITITLGGQAVGTVTTIGLKSLFILGSAISNTLLSFTDVAGTLNATIDNAQVFELSQIGYEIETDDGVSIFTNITPGVSTRFEDTAMISVDWTQAPVDGCYVVCNHDASDYREQICNGTFDVTNFWVLAGNWSIAGGLLRAIVANISDTATQTFLHPLIGGRCYTLTFDVLNAVTGAVNVNILPSGPTFGPISTNGAKSFTIDLTGLPNQTSLEFEVIDPATSLDIDNVSIIMDTVCFEEDACSECYELTDDWDDFDICTQLMSATNSDNAFGFEYENLNFTQFLRHPSFLWKPTYPLDQIDHEDSAGTATILRAKSVKVRNLDMDVAPEYIHDAMRLFIRHDDFEIDSVQYFALPQDYDPDWDAARDTEVAPVIIPVRLTTEDNVNENCQ